MIELTLGAPWAALCTRSIDTRYVIGKVYIPMQTSYSNGEWVIVDEEHNTGHSTGNTFSTWYERCCWRDYDFKEVQV